MVRVEPELHKNISTEARKYRIYNELEKMMNKYLVISGGVLNLVVCFFHAMFWKLYGWPKNLLCLHPDDQARMQVLVILLIMVFAFFSFTSLFHHKAMLSTSIGRGIAWFIIAFYFIRIINQLIFWDAFLPKSIVIMISCIIFILIYLIPLLSSNKILKT